MTPRLADKPVQKLIMRALDESENVFQGLLEGTKKEYYYYEEKTKEQNQLTKYKWS